MKKIALLIFLTVLVVQTFAQDSVKFDEFSSVPRSTSSPLIDRGNRLAKQLLKEPKSSKAVIIFYNERKGTYPLNTGKEWADYTKGILSNGYKISLDRILIIDGGYREFATLEYWISTHSSPLPRPTSTFALSDTVICPEINVAADGFKHDRRTPLIFSVSIKGSDPETKLGFRWKTSAGLITIGQGTNSAAVDLSNTEATRVTASVQIDGLNPECNNFAWKATEVGAFPFLYADIQYNYSYLAALIDALYIELNNDPKLRGLIIFYGPRIGTRREVTARITAAKQLLAFRRFDVSRVTIQTGGFREDQAVELYLVPNGIDFPKPTPTVDEKFVVFTDERKKKNRGGK